MITRFASQKVDPAKLRSEGDNALRYALTPVAKTLFSGLLVDSAWRASVIGRAMAHVGWLRVFAVVTGGTPSLG